MEKGNFTCYESQIQSKKRRKKYKMPYRLVYTAIHKIFYAGVSIALLVWLFKLI